LESNIPGIYLAGVIVAGNRTNEIFIENGRFHGEQIARDLHAKRTSGAFSASESITNHKSRSRKSMGETAS
jgi:hypothetical protein